MKLNLKGWYRSIWFAVAMLLLGFATGWLLRGCGCWGVELGMNL